MEQGLDASNWQGKDIDWDAVAAAGVVWAAVKCSEGTWADPTFPRNWSEMGRVGLRRFAYDFARPSANTPDVELAFLEAQLQQAGGLRTRDGIWLDLEDTKVAPRVDLSGWALGWLDGGTQVFGVKPVLYSGLWYMQPHGLLTPELAQYGLAYASYQATMPPPPAPWPVIAFWQYGAGTVPGITSGQVDLDVFNGPLESLDFYLRRDPAPPPVPQPAAGMTNDDAIQVIRLLLPPGALDPAAADAYLQPFVGGSHAASQSLASPAAAVHPRPTPSAARQPRGERGRFATLPRAGSGAAAGCKQ